jgi:hypothetical protein
MKNESKTYFFILIYTLELDVLKKYLTLISGLRTGSDVK